MFHPFLLIENLNKKSQCLYGKKLLGSFLLRGGENSMREVQVDGEKLATDDVVRVARENAKNSSVKARALLKFIVSNRNKLFTCTL